MNMEERLDKLLVIRNLVTTRIKAEQIIQNTGVKVNGKLINKPGKKFTPECKIELIAENLSWIHIESLKLVDAISSWDLPIENGKFITLEQTTGAFAEVLLKNKASKIYFLNGNKDNIDLYLKNQPNIIDLSQTIVRELTLNTIKDEIDGCIIDEPELSMNKILPFIHPIIQKNGFVVAVIKPELEVSKEHLKKNGNLRNKLGYSEMFETLKTIGLSNNLQYIDHRISPILGNDKQQEFLILYKKI